MSVRSGLRPQSEGKRKKSQSQHASLLTGTRRRTPGTIDAKANPWKIWAYRLPKRLTENAPAILPSEP